MLGAMTWTCHDDVSPPDDDEPVDPFDVEEPDEVVEESPLPWLDDEEFDSFFDSPFVPLADSLFDSPLFPFVDDGLPLDPLDPPSPDSPPLFRT